MKAIRSSIILLLFIIVPGHDIDAQKSPDIIHLSPAFSQNTGIIKGRLIDSKTNLPVCYADISCGDKTTFTKSNSKGEFLISPPELPATLKIRKFGYNEKTIQVSSPEASLLIPLIPLEIYKESGKIGSVRSASLLKTAVEKLKKSATTSSSDRSQRKLVYCRITSSVDSTMNSLFESYAQMNVTQNSLREYQSGIARFASAGNKIPGISENNLEFNIDPYIGMSFLDLERYIKNKGYFDQDGNRIDLVGYSSGETETIFYINVADTSVVYIKSRSKSGKKIKLKEPLETWQDKRISTTEVSFSPCIENKNCYQIDCIIGNESFTLIQKNRPDRTISQSTLFAPIPDFSPVNNAVKEYLLNENLAGSKQQINYTGKYSLNKKSTSFNSEIQKLFLRPYMQAFWAQNRLIKPDALEQKQIQSWENNNRFYSENSLSRANQPGVDSLVKIMNKNIVSVEKVYLELDRPDYLAGDTIWFSVFVLDNRLMDSTSMSKILYVDLINAENKLEKQLKLLIKNGRAKGDFELNKELKNGIFRVRAYTHWMRNFQSEYFFEKEIPVYQSDIKNLVAVNPVITKSGEGDSVNLFLQVLLPAGYKTLENQLAINVRLNDSMSVRKNFSFKEEFRGSLGFFVPASISCSSADIKLTLSDTAFISEQRLSMPLKPGIDVQFFPESGKMVAGIETVIAWKAVDGKGNPTAFDADIVDENKSIVTRINGNKSGVGKFNFTPLLSKTYKAVVTLSGSKYVFNLPLTEPMGYVLTFNSDSSSIYIKNNQSISESRCFLLISVRGTVYTAVEMKLDTGTVRIHLPFKAYPKGIVQITLFDSLYRPLAERLVFNNRPDKKMLIRVETDKKEYRPREKVNLTINVTNTAGNPVESSLSLAVVDGSKTDSSIFSTDIESYLWLASELNGKIDYTLLNLADTTSSGNRNIDLVMMTQGWRNYLWNSIRYSNTLKDLYPIEKGFYMDGSAVSSNNRKPISDYNLNFFDAKTFYNDVIKLNEKGSFKIEFPLFYNTHILVIQNKNKKGRIDDLRFSLDTVPVPGINFRNNEIPYVSYKPGYLKAINEKFAEVDSKIESPFKDILLKEVKVTAKRPFFYSKADITIDLEKKDPTGKKYKDLFQLIEEEFGEKAFFAKGSTAIPGRLYFPMLVVNGMPMIDDTATDPPLYSNEYYLWAAGIPVNEISDVKYYEAGSEYSQFCTPPPDLRATYSGVKLYEPGDYYNAFITPPLIRTRLDGGRVILPVISFTTRATYRGNPKGTVIIPFQGIYKAKEFYKPNYELNDNNTPDNRTTIYWNPEIKTDSTGTANVSFYNSDLKGNALIRISGVSYQIKDASSVVSHYGSDRMKE